MKASLIVLLPLLAVSSAIGATSPYTVKGTSDLWLSGAASGTLASTNDYLYNAAPLEITGIIGGTTYTFSVTGSVNNTKAAPFLSPDGGSFTSHTAGAQNGISNITAPFNSLIGVFLNNAVPVSGDAAPALNFSTITTNFNTLMPMMNQVFFIGDGKTSSGLTQTFLAPTAATRLFLGTMDGYEWNNNSGKFYVDMTVVPEPATYAAFLGAATLGVVAVRRYRQRKD